MNVIAPPDFHNLPGMKVGYSEKEKTYTKVVLRKIILINKPTCQMFF